ncbi:MAG: C10 family peptidase [Candidatus Cloacimonas sp.]|nr:C10 family peptidase [Candidatus Cloacimonas sp.]
MKLTRNQLARIIILVAGLCLISIIMWAKVVEPENALLAARNYLKEAELKNPVYMNDVELFIYNEGRFLPLESNKAVEFEPTLYYINYANGNYAIVSAEDNFYPVLAYSDEGLTNINNLPPAFYYWLENYSTQIKQIREAKLEYPENVQLWQSLIEGSYQNTFRTERSVTPLVTTMWDQGWPYNALCPVDSQGSGGHVYTGCVATAMGMVMKYWNHPQTGVGNESYYCPGYGYQSANFGNTTYLWDQMNDTAGATEAEYLPIATLLYHCGVAVHMGYSVDGSGAQSTDAAVAFVDHFRYPNAQYVMKSSYTEANWNNLLTAQVDNGCPVYYSGYDPAEGGHAFVMDGYDTTNHFHFNFGWSGSGNGYFYTSNPGGFTDNQSAIINTIPQNYSISTIPVKLIANDTSAGDNFNVSIKTNPILGSWNVNHYDIVLYYDSEFVDYIGYSTTGTISANGNITVVENSPGMLSIDWNNTTHISGGGVLINLTFRARDMGDFLFDITSMHYNTTQVTNVSYIIIHCSPPVASLAESRIFLTNILNLNYNTIGTTNMNTTYILPSWNVTQYQNHINYNPVKLEYTGIITEGTLSANCEVIVDTSTSGVLNITGNSTIPLFGAGALLKIQFRAIGNTSSISVTQITISDFFYNDTAISDLGNANVMLSSYTANDDEIVAVPEPKLEIYPNPFQDNATLKFTGTKKEPVRIKIYNIKGQLINKLLISDPLNSQINWNGSDGKGKTVADGIYFLRWQQGEHSGINKILVIK